MSVLDIWYDRIDWQSVIEKTSDEKLQKRRKDILKQAKKRTVEYYFPKMAEEVDGKHRIKDSPPLISHMPEAMPSL